MPWDLNPKKLGNILWTILLYNYGLFTFQKRLLENILLFSHSVMNFNNSHPKLQEFIKLSDNSTVFHWFLKRCRCLDASFEKFYGPLTILNDR